jgi:chromosome segregation ATPase
VVPAALLPVSPPLPPPSSAVVTSPTDARVKQQTAEIQRLSDELTSLNRRYEDLQSQNSSVTADFEAAKLKISELDSTMEVLKRELVTSRSELESTKVRFSNELANKDVVLLTARNERDAAVGRVDSVIDCMVIMYVNG